MQHDSHCDSLFESTPVDDSDDDRDNTSQEEGSAARKAGATLGEKAHRFVDTEAGRSSGSEADDDAEDDDEEAGMDGFVVKDEEATSSDYETEEEEAPIAHGRLRRGSDSVERAAAEALLGRSLEGLSIMRLEAPRARDVVAGTKTLELTEGLCKKRGLTPLPPSLSSLSPTSPSL